MQPSKKHQIGKTSIANFTRSSNNTAADLVIFTEEVLNGKLHFCAVLVKGWARVENKNGLIFGLSSVGFSKNRKYSSGSSLFCNYPP